MASPDRDLCAPPAQWPHHTAYDPAMVLQLTVHPDDDLIWPHYDALTLPVLLRGVASDLVLPETAAEMRHRGPGARG